jgi:hypothetical protein
MENETMATYNGWANYATWRVNLEVFDGLDPRDMAGDAVDDPHGLAEVLQAYAEDLIFIDTPEGLARDYAIAFLSQVDWREIAEHMVADYAETQED